MARRRGPARWPLVVLAATFAVVGGVGIAQSLGDDDDGDGDGGGSDAGPERMEIALETVDGSPAAVEVRRRDVDITYRVEGSTADGGAIVDTERHRVRAPYDSRVETVPGEDGDAEATFLQIAGFGLVQTGREDEEPVPLGVEPAVAPGDVFVDVSELEWRGEAREVLDRRCEVYRNGGPIDVASVTAPTDADHADLCVTEDGLLLHESWTVDGNLFRVRIATELDESPSLDDELFQPSATFEPGPRTGVLAELTADSLPPGVAYYELPAVPDGFVHRGRYGYTPPRAQLQPNQPEPRKVALVLDLYETEDGTGLLVVANGGTSDRSPFVEAGEGSEVVDLGAVGEGHVVRGLRQQEVRAGFDGGRFLRVWGTLPVDALVDLARTLEPTTDPNGTLTPIS